jgi:alpha-2-macroglobulin
MKQRFSFLLVWILSLSFSFAAATKEQVQQAQKLYNEKSFQAALEIYKSIQADSEQKLLSARDLQFRIADCQWRAWKTSPTEDPTIPEKAIAELQKLADAELHDEIYANANVSIGDYHFQPYFNPDQGETLPYYQKALDFWAASSDMEKARTKYLEIVFKFFPTENYNSPAPLEIIDRALEIAKSKNDKARLHYLAAISLRFHGGDTRQQQRLKLEYQQAIELGKGTDWHDDALFHYADFLENHGSLKILENGSSQWEPDYVEALKVYRQFVELYPKGKSLYYDQAKRQIENITKPTANIRVPSIFLPDSDIFADLNWRNEQKIKISIYEFNIFKYFQTHPLVDKRDSVSVMLSLSQLNLKSTQSDLKLIKSWDFETNDDGKHVPGNKRMDLPKLEPGSYLAVIEGSKTKETSIERIYVSTQTLTTLITSEEVLFFATDAVTGKPLTEAEIIGSYTYHQAGSNYWDRVSGTTDANGLLKFQLKGERGRSNRVVVAILAKDGQHAIAEGSGGWDYGQSAAYKIDVFTDRPAYRPKDKVQFNAFIRHHNGSVYTTPSGKWVQMEVHDAQGKSVFKKEVQIDSFGSVQGDFLLDEKATLGMYQINFAEWNPKKKATVEHWGNAQLFRLEEYKLPEFKVTVSAPEKNFMLGDKIEVSILAETYFGAPVANTSVEVIIKQKPYQFWYEPPHPYPWYYNGSSRYGRGYYYNDSYAGSILKRETLKTNAQGKTTLTVDTPANGQDLQYTIEARVTDSSRREIVDSKQIKVTQQSYYVFLNPAHQVYQPKSKISVNLVAKNANEQSVEADGKVIVSRLFWLVPEKSEPPIQPLDREDRIYPPPQPQPALKTEVITTQKVKIKKDGTSAFEFTPEKDGFYKIEWVSNDRDGMPIKSESQVYVGTKETQSLGYNHGSIQIILDKDTYHKGDKARAVLITPKTDSWVLLTTETSQIHSSEVLHLDGTAKFIEIPIDDKHQPNFFINALSIRDRQMMLDQKEVIVPPADKFIDVKITSPEKQYQPQQKGRLDILTKDFQGKPISARVALTMMDSSLLYIQSELTTDIREFFYGDKRSDSIQPQSSFQQKQYQRWMKKKDAEEYINEDTIRYQEQERRGRYDGFGGLKDNRDYKGLAAEGYRSGVGLASESLDSAGGGGSFRGMSPVSAANGAFAGDDSGVAKSKKSLVRPKQTGALPDEEANLAEITVRSDFRNTILWNPTLTTDEAGKASVDFTYPDSLTTWKASVRSITTGTEVGNASTETKTSKPLVVRLQAPRFFTQRDKSTLSAVVNNNTDKAMTAKVNFKVEGMKVEGDDSVSIEVKPQSEARVDLPVVAENVGTVKVTVYAKSGKSQDAMAKSYPIIEHGMERFIAYTDMISASDESKKETAKFTLNLPKERLEGSPKLQLTVAPSLAVTCLDALPYLLRYPYGCVEQTMSRFLPAAIVARTLEEMQLDPLEIEKRIFGGIDPEFAKQTHKNQKEKFSKLKEVTREGLERLYDFQHEDGGWGWWKKGESDHYMTAYVVQGLWTAKQGGIEIRDEVLERAVNYLRLEIVEEENNPDMLAWMLYAASPSPIIVDVHFQKQIENLWTNREKLNSYTLALFALTMEKVDHQRALVLIRNLENGVQRDDGKTNVAVQVDHHTTATAHWGKAGICYRWSDGGVESTAFALKALVTIDPKNALVKPVMTWLVRNRRGTQWEDTKETAIVVLALTDYMKRTGETAVAADFSWKVFVNGKSVGAKTSLGKNVNPIAPSEISVPAKLLRDGENEIRIEREGQGPLYYSAYLSYYSLEEPIPAAGNEIFVKREYFRYKGRPTLLKGLQYDKIPLKDGDTILSGDRIEVKLTVEAKNDLEYLMFEDFKAAGTEAVQIQSGGDLYAHQLKRDKLKIDKKEERTNNSIYVYQELRDQKIASFISKLPEGLYTITYELRAEVPGVYHALPVIAEAMYVPEIRGNSDEFRASIEDKK